MFLKLKVTCFSESSVWLAEMKLRRDLVSSPVVASSVSTGDVDAALALLSVGVPETKVITKVNIKDVKKVQEELGWIHLLAGFGWCPNIWWDWGLVWFSSSDRRKRTKTSETRNS